MTMADFIIVVTYYWKKERLDLGALFLFFIQNVQFTVFRRHINLYSVNFSLLLATTNY